MNGNRASPDTLQKIAENNLKYVIWMLNETAILSDKPNSAKNNAYIESFVIHARILIEFLYSKHKVEDTILAVDYVEGWRENYTNEGKPLEISEFLENIKNKAHKMAAHLTKNGSERLDREWNRIKIRDEINKIILRFLEAVPDDSTISKKTKGEIKEIIEATNGPKGLASDITAAEINKTRLTGITGATGPSR